MAAGPALKVNLRYGTHRGSQGSPTDADHQKLADLCRRIAADMGDDAWMVGLDPTDTLSWPSMCLELTYSAFSPHASDLSHLAATWQPKLESAHGLRVRVDASTG
ncbi:MAG: hypothetical protein WDA07_13690 [Leucobacter sp.]